MNVWISQKARNFLTTWPTVTFSGRIVNYGSGYDSYLYIHSQCDGEGGTSLLLILHTRHRYTTFSMYKHVRTHTLHKNLSITHKIFQNEFLSNTLNVVKIQVFNFASCICFSLINFVGHKKILLILRGFLISSTQWKSSKMCELHTVCTGMLDNSPYHL